MALAQCQGRLFAYATKPGLARGSRGNSRVLAPAQVASDRLKPILASRFTHKYGFSWPAARVTDFSRFCS